MTYEKAKEELIKWKMCDGINCTANVCSLCEYHAIISETVIDKAIEALEIAISIREVK